MIPARPRILVITNIRSYHQVDLFDRVATDDAVDLMVWYLRPKTPGRTWTMPEARHPHRNLPIWLNGSVAWLNPTLLPELLRARADAVIVGQYSGLSYELAMLVASLRKLPWALWCEPPGVKFFEVENPIPEWARPLLRRMLLLPVRHLATEVWAVGKMAEPVLEPLVGRPSANLPYASDLARFGRRGAAYAPGGAVRFLFAGRRSFRKGFDTLFEAFARLDGLGVDPARWELHLMGAPSEASEALDPATLARAVDHGFIEARKVPEMLRGFDVFVAPSRYDGWGMVVPEALAAGMPVVSTTATGSAVDIGRNRTWMRLVAPGDAGALAHELADVIAHRERLSTWGAAAARAAQRYDVRRGARDFARLASRLAGRGGRPDRGAHEAR